MAFRGMRDLRERAGVFRFRTNNFGHGLYLPRITRMARIFFLIRVIREL
jgi:hypothetical protein